MESVEPRHTPLFELTLDSVAKDYLLKAAKWARFLAIFGLVITGIYIIILLFALLGQGASVDNMDYNPYARNPFSILMAGKAFIVGFIIIMGIYIYPQIALLQFANKAISAVKTDDQILITESLHNLKRFFQFIGILVIIFLAIFILILVFFGVAMTGMR